MIVYKDRSWCSRSQVCANKACLRNYNEEERHQNETGVDLPISQADFKDEHCGFKEI